MSYFYIFIGVFFISFTIYIFQLIFLMYKCMFSNHRIHQHPRHALLHFPTTICKFCLIMVLTGIISDVFALLTPKTVHTCTRLYVYTPHTSTFIHTNPRSPPHTRTRTHPYLVFILPFYLLVYPHMPVHAQHSTSTNTHLYAHTHFPLLIFTTGLLIHSDFSFLTRLCPFHEPGGSGTSSPPDWSSTPYAGRVLYRWLSQEFICPGFHLAPFLPTTSPHCGHPHTTHPHHHAP